MPPFEFEPFEGFSPQTFTFLENLKVHNSKVWFETHRREYERYLLGPLRQLVMELGEFMLTIDAGFDIQPAINKTISRIYRDTRFSKDKSLFRANMWIVFKVPDPNWKARPAFFFEIFPEWYRYGMGFYTATPDSMAALWAEIDAESPSFSEVLGIYHNQEIFELAGQCYKRRFDPQKPAEIQEWYQRRNIYLVSNHSLEEILYSGELVTELIAAFQLLGPIYHFFRNLCK